MNPLVIGFFVYIILILGARAIAGDLPKPPTETEVRAQAIISLLIQQRDEAMNQVAAMAVELAKARAQIEAQKPPPKK
jgi:hypothetical protein